MKNILLISAAALFMIAFGPILSLLATGDFTGPIHFYGLEEDSTLVDSVLSFREFFTK